MKIEIHKLQVARRIVQLSVIFMLVALPLISRYSNYVSALEIDKHLERWDGTLQGRILSAVDASFRALPGGETERVGQMVRDDRQVQAYTQGFRGGAWSAEIAGVSMSDPLAAAESIVARKKITKVVLISLIVPLIATLLLGRIFCSWICPMGLLLEMTDKLRRALKFLEIRPMDVQFERGTKYALLVLGLVMTAILSVPILGYIYPPAIISREAHDFVFGFFDRAELGQFGFWAGGLTWMSLIIGGIVAFEIFVSRRWWCRYMCPGGGLYSMIGFARPVRMKLVQEKCTNCGDCVVACPVGLNPMMNRMGIECDNCGECLSHCHDNALTYTLWPPGHERAETQTENNILVGK